MPSKNGKKPDAASSVTGAGVGTLVLGLAGLIPDNYPAFKSFVTFASPALAVGVSVISLILITHIKRRILKSEINISLTDARRVRDEVNSSPSSSAEHKKQVQQNVEKLELLLMAVLTEGVEEIRAGLGRDLSA